MSSKHRSDLDTHDGDILADLFDELLQEILEGRTPDLAEYLPDRPDLAVRVAKTWALACSVAGRREPSRPVMGGYEILRELGHGGMGTVYLARHQILQREVAIKVLPHSLAMSPRAKQRFLEEAKALARIRHDNVVHIHRILDHSEMLAFEMEYVDGPSLQVLVAKLREHGLPPRAEVLADTLGLPIAALGTRSPVEWFVRTCASIARALGEVHRHGLVHRDVKPANILLRADGTAVLADFGLARIGELDATQTGAFAGTPVYAAPERLRGGDVAVDARTDVYSLGITLYELLTLHPPFRGSSTHEVLRRIEGGDLPALRQQAPHVSRDLATVVQKAMESNSRDRYASADEFADDLDRLLNFEPIHAQPIGALRRTAKFLRRNSRVATAAVVGALIVAMLTWPIVAHAQNVREAQLQAGRQLQAARSQLLSPETLHLAWTQALAGTSRQPLRSRAAQAAHLEALQVTAAAYEQVLELDPDNEDARGEGAAVRAAIAVHRVQSGGQLEEGQLEQLPPLLAAAVRNAVESGAKTAPPTEATIADRFALGLFAFLRGDAAGSHAAWQGLDSALPEQPLLEACMALQLTNGGNPERAFPHLFHAIRTFPNTEVLALAMADAALLTGDTAMARAWLERTPQPDAGIIVTRRRLLEADLLAARGDSEGAARIYRELRERDFSDSVPAHRLARLALADGNRSAARRLLASILQRWPEQAMARRDLAWLELQQRNLAGYLRQARFAMGQDLSQLPPAAAHSLAEILWLGGLPLPPAVGLDDGSWRPSPRDRALPLSTWLSGELCASIGATLRFAATMDRAQTTAQALDARPVGTALRTIWLTALSTPQLTLRAHPIVSAALLGGPPVLLGQATDLASVRLAPFWRILGNESVVVRPEALARLHDEPHDLSYARHLVPAGDVNGDSLDDFCLVCTNQSDDGAAARIEVRSVTDGSLLHTIRSADGAAEFAHAVAALGDADGDHCTDLLISTRGTATTPGRVELRSGRTGLVLWQSDGPDSQFGASMAALADTNGDGIADFITGSQGAEKGVGGRAYLCSGADGSILRQLPAETANPGFGAQVINIGDTNADGWADVIVTGSGGDAAGSATVYSGATLAVLATFADDSTSSDFGFRAAGLGDIDADGHADFAITAPGFSDLARQRGVVKVISGRTGKLIHELQGEQPGNGFGMAVCGLPHWRRDGRPAIAIAAYRGGPGGAGYVRVFDAETARPLQTVAANPGVHLFGGALIDLGDRTGDGLRDLGLPIRLRTGAAAFWSVSFALVPNALR